VDCSMTVCSRTGVAIRVVDLVCAVGADMLDCILDSSGLN